MKIILFDVRSFKFIWYNQNKFKYGQINQTSGFNLCYKFWMKIKEAYGFDNQFNYDLMLVLVEMLVILQSGYNLNILNYKNFTYK